MLQKRLPRLLKPGGGAFGEVGTWTILLLAFGVFRAITSCKVIKYKILVVQPLIGQVNILIGLSIRTPLRIPLRSPPLLLLSWLLA